MNMSFGWDEAIRPQRFAGPSSVGSSPDLKRKRFEGAAPVAHAAPGNSSSPRRIKKQRANSARCTVPVRRRLESLSHHQLFELVEQLCESTPEFYSQISRHAPQITAESALSSLKQYLVRVHEAMPFGSEEKPSDYGYLRVQPVLHEFFVALTDYTLALLPPNETSLHRSLEFLDGASELLHRVPEWDNQLNNFYKNRAYGEMTAAWTQVINVLKDSTHIVLFDVETRLQHHAQASQGRLQVQVQAPEPLLSVNVLPVLGNQQVVSM